MKVTPLLDIGTFNGEIAPEQGGWVLTVWPGTGECSVVFEAPARREVRSSAGSKGVGKPHQLRSKALESMVERDRSLSRARAQLRRYCGENGLTEMVSLTFAQEVEESVAWYLLALFFKRWEYVTGLDRGPWAAVAEHGAARGRVHLHVGVWWWDQLGCVEVCGRCARARLLDVRPDVPAAGESLCIGCLWGRGFVGRPDADGGLSGYLAKYLGKDLLEPRAGQHRYRVGRGHAPKPLRGRFATVAEAVAAVRLPAGGEMQWETSDSWSGYRGPPVSVGRVWWAPEAPAERGAAKQPPVV